MYVNTLVKLIDIFQFKNIFNSANQELRIMLEILASKLKWPFDV